MQITRTVSPYSIGFVIILLIQILLRFNYFNAPVYAEDTNLIYLIARHMQVYHENASSFLVDNGYGAPTSSPIYTYLVSGLVRIHDDIYFLGSITLVFQVLTWVCMYTLAVLLLNKPAAMLSVLLFSATRISYYQSTFMWPPYVMQPVLYVSFVFLAYSYRKKDMICS